MMQSIRSYDIALSQRQLTAFKLLEEARALIERAHRGFLTTGISLAMWIQAYQDAGFDEPDCERYDLLDFEQVKKRENAVKNLILAFGWQWQRKGK